MHTTTSSSNLHVTPADVRMSILDLDQASDIKASPKEINSTKRITELTKLDLIKAIKSVKQHLADGYSLKSAIARCMDDTDLSRKFIVDAVYGHNQTPESELKSGQTHLLRGHIPLTDLALSICRAVHAGKNLDQIRELKIDVTPEEVEEIVLSERISKIMQIRCISNAEFAEDGAKEVILAAKPDGVEQYKKPKIDKSLPSYLAALYDSPLLTKEQEQHLFRKYNFLKWSIIQERVALNSENPSEELLAHLERLHDSATEIKSELTTANLRLVVFIAKKRTDMGRDLFDLVSDGNFSLSQAIENFDYGRGFKFSTYATWAIINNFRRTISNEMRHQQRFETGHEEFITDRFQDRKIDTLGIESSERLMAALQLLMGQLCEREREIISMRFGIGYTRVHTLKEVGEVLGITKERVRQIESSALDKLEMLGLELKLNREELFVIEINSDRQKQNGDFSRVNYCNDMAQGILEMLSKKGGRTMGEIKALLGRQGSVDEELDLIESTLRKLKMLGSVSVRVVNGSNRFYLTPSARALIGKS